MKIETVKWSWADEVQSKNVYRDDQFVRSKTKEDALQAIDFLLKKPVGLTYTITVKQNDEYLTYYRHSMPCLGGLVKYKDSHGPKYYMNPYFPRDIYVKFPDGDVTYIGCHRQNTKNVHASTPYYEFIFSKESPWISAFNDKNSIIFQDNYFVLTDMDSDPTVFYSLMRLAGFAYHNAYANPYSSKKWNPKAEILATKTSMADPRRLAGQKPIKISGGTWKEGFGYTRPYNESIFKEKLPHKLEEFGKLGGYPQAPHNTNYFHQEMKKVFNVDTAKGITDKMEPALVEAWDYFKEKSKELDAAA